MKELKDRRYERFRVKVPVYVAVEGGTLRKVIPLESRDVSVGGVSFETSHEVPLSAKSKVVVSLGDPSGPALIHGRVAYLKQDPVGGRYTVGLEFVGFENVTREELLARIDAWAQDEASGST